MDTTANLKNQSLTISKIVTTNKYELAHLKKLNNMRKLLSKNNMSRTELLEMVNVQKSIKETPMTIKEAENQTLEFFEIADKLMIENNQLKKQLLEKENLIKELKAKLV